MISRVRTTQLAPPVKAVRRTSTLDLVQPTSLARRLAKTLLVGLLMCILGMAFLPWQQTSKGTGSVVAFVPQERQQVIQSPTKGVVARIADGLVEGSRVKKGDFILEIQPFAVNMVDQLNAQASDLQSKLDSVLAKAEAYSQNVTGFTEAKQFAVSAAQQLVAAAEAKLEGKQKLVAGYTAKELQARLNYERQEKLLEQGLKPRREIEILKKEWDVTSAELKAVQQDVQSLEKELAAKQDELEERRRVVQSRIDYARAMQQDALGNAATIRKEMRDLEIKLAELSRLKITAPRDGTIYRMPVYEQGQTIMEGDSILTLIPEATQKAVELFVDGNDMPLIRTGQHVQLQFEGWPAVQAPGWPSIAVGVFGGSVANVDATDNGQGQFRVLVLENESQPWPSDQILRQGVRVNGWVMLRRVSLGYEIWRQINGFPVILEDSKQSDGEKPPKLPK